MRGTLEERFDTIVEILDDPDTTARDKIRCLEWLARYGIGQRHEIDAQVERPEPPDLEELRRAIARRLPRTASDD